MLWATTLTLALAKLKRGKPLRAAAALERIASQISLWKEDPCNPGIVPITRGQQNLLVKWLDETAKDLDPKGKRFKVLKDA